MQGSIGLAPGMVFAGDYRIIRPLSSGGMGAVYVAQQLSTDRERALKIMLGELAGNEDLKRRFAQEARIGAQIESEHVVEVVGAGIEPTSGTPWLAMELLLGESLSEHIGRVGALPPALVLELFSQLAHAVGAAHAKQIIHRDLKPDNIFLARSRREGAPFVLKVLDFGIAKLLGQARTSATGAMGTPLWMAPEQTSTQGAITPAADVWALGLIAFLALTGRSFWRSAANPEASSVMVLREVVMEPIPPASARAAELGAPPLPAGFDAWFARCVAREPKSRFRDANEMQRELRAILATGGAGGPAYFSPTVRTKGPSRLGLLIGLGVAALLALAIALSVSMGVFAPKKSRRASVDDEPEPPKRAVSSVASAAPVPSARASNATTLEELDVPVATASARVAVDPLADDPNATESTKLDTDLSRVVETAPLLTAPLPGLVDWLDTANFRVPNPGWRVFRRTPEGIFLAAPDKQGDVVIFLFKTQSDVETLLRGSRVHDWKWHLPNPRTVGPNALPALVGKGRALSIDGQAVTVLYALLKGDPQNLLVISTCKTRGGEADLQAALGIIGNIKKP